MNQFKRVLLLAIPVSLAVACGEAENGSSVEAICQKGCATAASLNCSNPPADCEANCVSNYNSSPDNCRSQLLAYGECVADQPASDWQCDVGGEARPKAGVCESRAGAECAEAPELALPDPPQQAAFWITLSAGQGGTCPSSRTFALPTGAQETVSSIDAVGDRIVDGSNDVVECSVSAAAGAGGSFNVSTRISSGEIGDFSLNGLLSVAGGELDLGFTTTSFSLEQDGCTATVETVKAGAIWIKSLSCPQLRDQSSPGIACMGNGGLILENCGTEPL